MSDQTENSSIIILRITNISRALVLFTLGGLSSVVYHTTPEITLLLLSMFVLDCIAFLLLLFSRTPLKQFGYAWVGVLSIILIFGTSPYLGNTYFFSDVIVILLLSIIQLLTLLKIAIDSYNAVSVGVEDV